MEVSATHLSWRADTRESGDHHGPQILPKLVLALPGRRVVLTLSVASDSNITQTRISQKRKPVVCVTGKSGGGDQVRLDPGLTQGIGAPAPAPSLHLP